MPLGLFSKKESSSVPWIELNSEEQLGLIDQKSKKKPVLLFKHSTSCPISSMSLNRFERSYTEEAHFDPYFLDLITFRQVSNQIAERYGVPHESPQVILVKDGKAVYDTSHNAISFEEADEQASRL